MNKASLESGIILQQNHKLATSHINIGLLRNRAMYSFYLQENYMTLFERTKAKRGGIFHCNYFLLVTQAIFDNTRTVNNDVHLNVSI